MTAAGSEGVGNLVRGDVDHLGELFVGRLALVLLLELREGFVDLVKGTDLVQRKTDDTALLGQGLENGLTDPPNRVGNEFKAAGLIELLGGLDQAEVAFVDQIGQAEALVLILLRHGNDETEVGAGEFFEGFLVAFADALGEFHFFFRGDELLATDFLQVLVQRGAFPVGNRFGNLQLSHSSK